MMDGTTGIYIRKLYNSTPISIYVGLFAVFCLGVLFLIKRKGLKKGMKQSFGLLACEYVILIYCSTVIFRKTVGAVGHNLNPFWSYTAIQNGQTDLIDVVVMNVMAFVPIGVLIGLAFSKMKWWIVVQIGIGISLAVEVLQYILKRGYAEVDDVIHNTLGCLIGFMLVKKIKGIWKFCSFLFVPQWGRHPKDAEIQEP